MSDNPVNEAVASSESLAEVVRERDQARLDVLRLYCLINESNNLIIAGLQRAENDQSSATRDKRLPEIGIEIDRICTPYRVDDLIAKLKESVFSRKPEVGGG